MKIQLTQFWGRRLPLVCSAGARPRRRRGEGGMATLIFIALLAIMMVLVSVELHSLVRLHTEVKLLEHQQLKRLNGAETNSMSLPSPP